jgi:hypothetical protein
MCIIYPSFVRTVFSVASISNVTISFNSIKNSRMYLSGLDDLFLGYLSITLLSSCSVNVLWISCIRGDWSLKIVYKLIFTCCGWCCNTHEISKEIVYNFILVMMFIVWPALFLNNINIIFPFLMRDHVMKKIYVLIS